MSPPSRQKKTSRLFGVAQLRVDEVILQGALDRVQDALGQLNIVVDKKFLLLRVGRADDKGAGVCKVDHHPALAGGDRLGKVEVPAGEVADLSNQPVGRQRAGAADRIFGEAAARGADVEGRGLGLRIRILRARRICPAA